MGISAALFVDGLMTVERHSIISGILTRIFTEKKEKFQQKSPNKDSNQSPADYWEQAFVDNPNSTWNYWQNQSEDNPYGPVIIREWGDPEHKDYSDLVGKISLVEEHKDN